MKRAAVMARMAYRDARGAMWKLLFFSLAMLFGVAGVVGTRMLRANLETHIQARSKALLGADVAITSRGPFSAEVEALLASRNLDRVHELRFRSLLSIRATGRSKLVQVRAVSGEFPLYGTVTSVPADAWQRVVNGGARGALATARVASQLGLRAGDIVAVADAEIPFAGTVEEGIVESGGAAFFAPPVYMSRASVPPGLLEKRGSLVDYRQYLRFRDAEAEREFHASVAPVLEAKGISITTAADRMEVLGGVAENFSRYFGIAGLTALLLGMLGAGTALALYLRGKGPVLALLRSLGASRGDLALMYSIQIGAVGAVASLAGALAGGALQKWAGSFVGAYFGGGVEFRFIWAEALWGAAAGLGALSLVAWPSVFSAGRMPPLAVLRAGAALPIDRRLSRAAALLGALFLAALSARLVGGGMRAVGSTFIVCASVAVLAGLARVLRFAARRAASARGPFFYRYAVSCLYRPENQTLSVVVVLGMLGLLLNVVALTGGLIEGQVERAHGKNRANTYLFDIQPDQRDGVARMLSDSGFPLLQETPIVLMRISSVKGRPVSALLADKSLKIPEWTLKRDYWTSYRSEQTENERILEGEWIARVSSGENPIPISVEDRLMSWLGVRVGDEIEFDLQGMTLKTIVASKRDILWERLERNSFIIFPAGVLEEAPQHRVLATRIEDSDASSRFVAEVAKSFPNVSVVDIASIIESLRRVLDDIGAALRFLFSFIAGAGILVLFASVLSSARARLRDGALLRTLGASRRTIRLAVLAEYGVLGLLAAAASLPLSLAAGWAIAEYLFKTPFVIDGAALALVGAGLVLTTLGAAAAAGLRTLRWSCADMLRGD